jgi:hypothetical protein
VENESEDERAYVPLTVTARRRTPRLYPRTGPNGSTAGTAVVHAGTDPLTGTPRYLRKSADTPAQAKVELTKLLSSVDEKRHQKSDVTVDEVIEGWLDIAELQDTTRQRHEGLVHLDIQPNLGKRNVAKLDAELLERFTPVSTAAGA